jgi:hypothetical protein
MKPVLLAAVIFSLTMLACHKKAASPPLPATAYFWKLARCEFDGPVKLVYLPPADSITRFDLLGNNQYLIYTQNRPQDKLLSQGNYTVERIAHPNMGPEIIYPDSVIKLNVSPVLTADSSWRLPIEGAFRVFHADSMVISTYPIPPSGLSTFTFVRVMTLPD